MADITLHTALDAIAREGFRDLADYDYISARVNLRLNLREQFYWSALQAVEKYLKAILLFNGQKVRDLSHYVVKINRRVEECTQVSLKLDGDQLQLLTVLEEFGNNRYSTKSTFIIGKELMALDKLVWTIRHCARSFRLEVDGVDKSESYLKNFLPPNPANTPTTIQFNDGKLESVLSNGSTDPLRQALVWCNQFYGESENAAQTPDVIHTSTHIPPYERCWFKNAKLECGKTLEQAVKEYVQFP